MVDRTDLDAYTDSRLAGLYDLVLSQVWSDSDLAFYVDQLTASGGPALELGCGTGRVVLPLARAGVAITGLDSSSAFLDILRSKLVAEPQEVHSLVTLVNGRMEELDIDREFAAAVIACNSFGHLLDRRSQQQCLQGIVEHLLPGGRLYMHVNASWESLSRPTRTPFAFSVQHASWVGCDDRLVRADEATGVVELQWIYEFIRPGQPYEKVMVPMTLKYTPLEELTGLLDEAGIPLLEVVREWRGKRLAENCLMLVAEKR